MRLPQSKQSVANHSLENRWVFCGYLDTFSEPHSSLLTGLGILLTAVCQEFLCQNQRVRSLFFLRLCLGVVRDEGLTVDSISECRCYDVKGM